MKREHISEVDETTDDEMTETLDNGPESKWTKMTQNDPKWSSYVMMWFKMDFCSFSMVFIDFYPRKRSKTVQNDQI